MRLLVVPALGVALVLAGCTGGSSGSTPTSPSRAPLVTSAGMVKDACSAMSLDSLQTATGRSGLTATGEFTTTSDGEHVGSCLVSAGTSKLVSVTVAPERSDPTLSARVRSIVSGRTAPVILPASAGVGFAQPESESDGGVTVAGAKALLLVAGTLVGVTVIRPAAGREAAQDAGALAQQVAGSLRLKP